jgi:cation transport ATPase
MFLGHYGVAFALKRAEPKLSLGTLFVAAQLLDLLWGIFVLLGWEHARIVPGNTAVTPLEFWDYPISHSLIGALAWSIVAAACYYSWPTRDTARHWQAAALVGLAVFSHYPLDVLVHVPDLPITGNDSAKLGLGLWNHPVATMVAELLVFGLGLAVYVALGSKRHRVRPGRLAVLVVVLLGTYFASVYGPPPPNMTTVGVSVIVIVLLAAALAAWADRRTSPEELEAQHLTPH